MCKFYWIIFREYIFVVESNLFYVLEELRKDVDRLDIEYNNIIEMLLSMIEFYEDVVKLFELIDIKKVWGMNGLNYIIEKKVIYKNIYVFCF